ncbi:MAG: ChaN family lipoprotein [Spirochaetota bacterium]|nr:ChaN family lipoprotein [Spirochaetota bacterium]
MKYVQLQIIIFIFLFFTKDIHATDPLPKYHISVSIYPIENRIKGRVNISNPSQKEIKISTGLLRILSIKEKGAVLNKRISTDTISLQGGNAIDIEYEGLYPKIMDEDNPNNPGVINNNIVSADGISLTRGWYPEVQGYANYKLSVTIPKEFIAISEAEHITQSQSSEGKTYNFKFIYPIDGINLVANRYTVIHDTLGDVDLYGYFTKQNSSIAPEYINYTKKYIKMYERLLGEYPFKRFSIVENVLQTGYSMPTFTLLGCDVLRLPFIVKTSLGHEILHQWFGNSVYINYKEGNWAEALTTYLSDHYYKEKDKKGWMHRKKILQDYQSYVNKSNNSSLIDFKSRTDKASSSIGYGKGAMLFHMLRNRIGDEIFFDSLRYLYKMNRFKLTSWSDIQRVFEDKYQKSLKILFRQWLDRGDIPSFKIGNTGVEYLNGTPNVKFTITQMTKPYVLDLKIVIDTLSSKHREIIHVSKPKESFEIAVNDTPKSITIDPDYDTMRRLAADEFPPTISRLLGDDSKLIITEADMSNYKKLVDIFKTRGFKAISVKDINDKEILFSSMILTDIKGKLFNRLFAGNEKYRIDNNRGFEINIINHPLTPGSVVALVKASAKEEVDLAARKIFRYGGYSNLLFRKGKNIRKRIAPSERGIIINLIHKVKGIIPAKAITLDEIIENIIEKPIIYIGESHSNYEDHKVQFEVIRALNERGRKFAIGMEMFQRPFQDSIDEYLSDKIDEIEFLRATEYFSRWRFNYHLYREIVNYAKAEGIPILALNADSNIIKRVSRGGLDALTDEERDKIPSDMDMSDSDYAQRLRDVYRLHPIDAPDDFNNFYQSQIIWDETMAHTIADFMKKNPDHQFVVLAGIGHIMYGSGIPQRVKRLNRRDYTILINSNIKTLDNNIADYVLYPTPLRAPVSLLLGVMVKSVKEGVKIDQVNPASIAHKMGLRKNDIITHLNKIKINSTSDLKLTLFDKKSGDRLKVQVLREGLLFGKNKHEFAYIIP